MDPKPKPWWRSKTTWVAVLTTIAGLAGVFEGQEWIESNPELVAAIAIVLGVVNTLLRAITNAPVTFRGGK